MIRYCCSVLLVVGACVATLGTAVGCSATSNGSTFEAGGDGPSTGSTTAATGGGGATGTGAGGSGNDGFGGELGIGGGGGSPPADADGDGFTVAEGDCNDDDRNVNPGAIEVVAEPDQDGNTPEPADEDCDGGVDNVITACDSNIAPADFDPLHGAKAIDLCGVATASDRKWGVLGAKYIRGNGTPATPSSSVGVLDGFGPNVHVQGGARMLVISSGHARLAGYPGACNADSCSTYGPGSAPPGFPQDNPNCPPSFNINDDIGLEVTLRAPTNATGYEFLFKFYSFEYPEWLCQDFNDQFLALASPEPPGSFNGNLSFDSAGNPVSVNFGFFDVCDGCPLGPDEMLGTGFNEWGDAGGTRWLKTRAPVTGGEEITLKFMIFDTGDDRYDSTAIVDGFRWIANGGTVAVGTTPIDNPL
jgi:hypothetical protein